MEKEIIKEVNILRKNPKGYVLRLIKNKDYFENGGKIWKHPDFPCGIQTEEGPEAYDEAIDFLRRKALAVDELVPSKGLNRIASDFLSEFQKDVNAKVDIPTVVQKYGSYTGNFRRLIEFGSPSAELVVVNLLVCDGDKSRKHREGILFDKLKSIGAAFGKHDVYRHCSVIVGCTKFENKYDSDDTVY